MERWRVSGGQPLQGQVRVSGAKNVAVKLMIAALLSDEETVLQNVPNVLDVQIAADMIRFLGGRVEFEDGHTVRIAGRGISGTTLPAELANQSRASFIFAGPLLVRCREVQLPLPGGDRIGRRPLERHFAGLQALGANIDLQSETVRVRCEKLTGAKYSFAKNSHTGTETLVLAAARAEGRTVLENAALEPEIDDLIAMLNKMGAKIARQAPRTIIIDGVPELGGARHEVMPDRNEVVSFACMALATRGDVQIGEAQPQVLQAFLQVLQEMQAGCELRQNGLHVWFKQPLRAIDVVTAPHPGVMSDWQPLLTTLLTQAHGTSTVHETIFERRFGYVDELKKIGARIELFNPEVADPETFYNFNWADRGPDCRHAARISGPTTLSGVPVTVADVRAGATLVQAALTARGETEILGVEHIQRGYEQFPERLQLLGAKIGIIHV